MQTTYLREVISGHQDRLTVRLRELVEIESPSGSAKAVNEAQKAVLGWVNARISHLTTYKSELYGNTVALHFGPKRSKRSRILLLGHLDTVWPIGTLQTMPYVQDSGRISGPGVLDMKAGVVMAIEALEALATLGKQRPVTLLLNSDEEIGSPFSRPITEAQARKCSAVFVLEPAQGIAYKTARKGIGNYEIQVHGVASHSGVDFETGHSAILEMSRILQTISGFTDLNKGLTVNAGVISGGTRSNVVPAECTIEVDVRIKKASDAPRIDRLFRSLKSHDKSCKINVSGGINRPPMERRAGTIALFRRAQSLAKDFGFELQEASTGGGSDGNFTAAIGIPTLDGMGAIGAGAHAAHEHILTKHLVERTALLASMIDAVD